MGYRRYNVYMMPSTEQIQPLARAKKRKSYYAPNLSSLPSGQRRAIEALIGGCAFARTYAEAADLACMSEGTLLTHVNRVRQNHPDLYEEIRFVRRRQLEMRHKIAMQNAAAHSRAHFRRQRRNALRYGYGIY